MCRHSDGRSAIDAPDEHMLQHHVADDVVSQDGDDFVVLPASATLDSRVEHEMADARMYLHTTIEAAESGFKGLWVRHSCQKNRSFSTGTEEYCTVPLQPCIIFRD